MKYELKSARVEMPWRKRKEIKPGCTMDCDMNPELISSFNSKEEALEALKEYKSEIRELSGTAGTYFLITEYYIEEAEYDSDGDWTSGGDVWGFSEMGGIGNEN